MYQIAKSKNVVSLFLSVPECAQDPHVSWLPKIRNELNSNLTEFCKTEKIAFCDFHSKFPWASLSEADKKKYWDDGLHFTAEG